jgi:hypothetical protein
MLLLIKIPVGIGQYCGVRESFQKYVLDPIAGIFELAKFGLVLGRIKLG